MKKIVLLIFSIFSFINPLNAETYYDYEKIEVESLPEASETTLNKVYIVKDKYYITKKIDSGYSEIKLGDNLRGKTIYFDLSDPVSVYNDLLSTSISSGQRIYVFRTTAYKDIIYFQYDDSRWKLHSSFQYNLVHYDLVNNTYVTGYKNTSITYPDTEDLILNDTYNTYYEEILGKYFSYTPFELTFEWIEVSKNDVIEIKIPTDDFYLFYDFDDIRNFNIFESYNFDTFTDFQKLVIVLGINILFLGFISICFYIFIRLIYKGISLLF